MVLAVDSAPQMLRRAPARPAHRVLADGSRLPVRDGSVSAVALINAFVFPAEVERVLTTDGVLLWVNISGEQTPIYLSTNDLLDPFPVVGPAPPVRPVKAPGAPCGARDTRRIDASK